jgi:heptosyltransferase II
MGGISSLLCEFVPVRELEMIMSVYRSSVNARPGAKGVLLVRLCNWVGEVLLSLPALRRLVADGYDLHLYGQSWSTALFEGTGLPVTVRHDCYGAAVEQLRGLRQTLGSDRSPALLMTNSFSSALEMRLAGFAPSGYAREGRSLLLRHAFPLPRFPHAAHAYWHLAGCFIGSSEPFPASLEWVPSDGQHKQALELLAQHGLGSGDFVMLCPFSGSDDIENRKVWPGFSELAAALHAANVPVLLCPGPGDEVDAAAWPSIAICLSGVDLGVYGAVQKLARIVVANDTGPSHLAAAVGARLITILGPQSVAEWAAIGPEVQIVQDAAKWPSVDRILALTVAASPWPETCKSG